MFEKAKENIKLRASMTYAMICARAHAALDGTKAEAYVDTGVKILIAVVIGALLIVGLIALFRGVILERTQDTVEGMFGGVDGVGDQIGQAIGDAADIGAGG